MTGPSRLQKKSHPATTQKRKYRTKDRPKGLMRRKRMEKSKIDK